MFPMIFDLNTGAQRSDDTVKILSQID